jgi:exonuclease III
MKILSWNCRGLSTPSAIPNLRNIAQGHKPDILFLSETLSKAQTMERVRVTRREGGRRVETNLLLWLPGEGEKDAGLGFVERITGHVRPSLVYYW